MHRGDERVDHGTAEIGDGRERLSEAAVFGFVPHLLAFDERRVEIIVEMDAVDIVFPQQVSNDVADALASLRHGGVVDAYHAVVFDKILGNLRVELREPSVGPLLLVHAVWVDPCMKRHASAVRLVDNPFEHIIRRCLAPIPRDILAPRLIRRVVERVSFRAYLEIDGIDIELLQRVEHLVIPCFLRGLCEVLSRPVDATDGSDPYGAHLPWGHGIRLHGRILPCRLFRRNIIFLDALLGANT